MGNKFENRHIGIDNNDSKHMLNDINEDSIEKLIQKTIPDEIKINEDSFKLDPPMTEFEILKHMEELSNENKVYKSYIGLGYNFSIMPSVIKRNILENPSWYTAYTPYQSEISQGRLNAIFNFQSMITDLTKMDIANASLLDEATAAAEAMIMLYNTQNLRNRQNNKSLFISNEIFPQNLSVIKTRAKALGIKIITGKIDELNAKKDELFGAIFQIPTKYGNIQDINKIEEVSKNSIGVCVIADIMSLALIEPPKVDIIVGSTQRFGLPMGYGGPHSAFFATLEKYKRNIPGRIIGLSKDKLNRDAFRMALQTREQHIRKEKATSNICTSQVLLAVISSMYAIYHGKKGISKIANTIHNNAKLLSLSIREHGLTQINKVYFDTLKIKINEQICSMENIKSNAKKHKVNLLYIDEKHLSISLNEASNQDDIIELIQILTNLKKESIKNTIKRNDKKDICIIDDSIRRKSSFLTNKVFNTYHSETKMMRYIKMLEKKDINLTHSMIPLGSCTMKLNSASQLSPISNPLWADIHPFCPLEQSKGYKRVFKLLEEYLCKITGFECASLQPNSGAQGEYLGLLIIKEYFSDRKEMDRNIVLIPSSAHGTNPASAIMAGLKVVSIKCDQKGNIDLTDTKQKIDQYGNNIAGLMVTYPSTHGVFEKDIKKITDSIHKIGALVYMDGANMNAQIGLTNPAKIGADICHLNLHKTFAIPHGGGGPGMGPICAIAKLKKFMPSHPLVNINSNPNEMTISSAPYGSSLISLISYSYIRLLSNEGLTNCSKIAILNANYLKSKLEKHFKILYTGPNDKIAHEFIIDCREFKTKNIDVADIAKRLIDYGFHAPTVSFPVNGTLMIEPTESEGREELDKFCQAMIHIKKEIDEIGKSYDKENNPLKNAPHNLEWLIENKDNINYSLQVALYPMEYIRENKFFPPVSRINDAYGDRNLICSCGINY